MASKRKRILKLLYQRISHDPLSYDPNWKWEWLPADVRDNFELIKPKLKEWEKEGYIELVESEEIVMIIKSVPPLNSIND